MRERWVIRYDGWIDDELETTWESFADLHEAVQNLVSLTKKGWDNVFMEYEPESYEGCEND